MNTRIRLMVPFLLLVLATAACGLVKGEPTGTPPAVQLMPESLPGYKIVQVDNVLDYIKTLGEGGALLSGNPALAALIERLDGTIDCYQEIGAVSARVFSSTSFPLSTGAIAIIDHKRLTDPTNFFRCVTSPGGVGILSDPAVKPCSHTYTLERDGNKFYILYFGTTEEICHAFCSNLEGCDRH